VSTPTRQELLPGPSSSSDSIAELLANLATARARAPARPRDRPFVTLAYAQSLDGSITTARGERYRLSGPDALRFTHALRARHDAILVGVGTVLADDPELRVRLVSGPSPQPVVVDSRVRTPAHAKLLGQPGRPAWIAATALARDDGDDPDDQRARAARVEAQGCRIVDCPALPNGWVDLHALLRRLAADGVESLMVEGGARIITSFLEARLVDYALVTIAPQFLGGLSAVGPSARSGIPAAVASLTTWVGRRLGEDLVLGGELTWPSDG
jgi:3,4-dihydroxy 2-butanone 4-phosphate synthase/GTP cyclohydrolase II